MHALTISCPTMPPTMAAIGESVAEAPAASWSSTVLRDASSSCAALLPASAAPLSASASASTAAASASLAGGGRLPPCVLRYSSSARKPRWSSPERP